MTRGLTRAYQLVVDLFALGTASLVAWLLRFDWEPPATMVGRLLLVTPYVVVFQYLVLVGFGVHRRSWRYVGLNDALRIVSAVTLSSTALLLARFALGELQHEHAYLRHGVVPMGVLFANSVLAIAGLTGVRVLRRVLGERADAFRGNSHSSTGSVPVVLVGAGEAGVLVAREIERRSELGLTAVAFLDDDRTKIGTLVQGVPVVGATSELRAACAKHGASQVIITMASAPGSVVRRIRSAASEAGIAVKIVPGVYELVSGNISLSRIRDVAIEDLLRREPVTLDEDAIARVVRDKVVLVTGAGGSIGAELCRQACRFSPRRLVLVERAENNLFAIHRELLESFPDVPIEPLIADVCERPRMSGIFSRLRPAAVLHAAAHKHVPMMEWNPSEAVKNNVGGTRVVAELAHAHNAETFVMISTDKAVNPTSVMGAAKRAAEIYVQSLAERSDTRFVTVRFGNVLGSAGSVVPIFKSQIAAGGPLTVTHPEMRRYFMTIPEACQLVLQAGSMGSGGEIFILDMGEPLRIVDLARDLIALSGLRADDDIEIRFTGMRPGEKLFEELSSPTENAGKTAHPKIFVGRTPPLDAPFVLATIETLLFRAADANRSELIDTLRELVPEYTPSMTDTVAPPSPTVAPDGLERAQRRHAAHG
ncbi:MAG: polysaccharide biosynthesis protein [Polyangiaceae bacterium]|nr:polysaccharide biosynthesis protein [Polyangiaceae bacterium]